MTRLARAFGLSPAERVVAELAVYNVVPLLGVALLGWSVGETLVFYWVESVAVGFWVFPKFVVGNDDDDETDEPTGGADGSSGGSTDEPAETRRRQRSLGDLLRAISGALRTAIQHPRAVLGILGFFGLFWLLYGFWLGLLGFFVVIIGGIAAGGTLAFLTPTMLAVAVVSSFGHHAVEFYRDFWRGGKQTESFLKPMLKRVGVLMVTVLFGTVPAALGASVVTVAVLVSAKFVLDLAATATNAESELTVEDLSSMVSGWSVT